MSIAAESSLINDWENVRRVIQESKRLLITTHVNADPDALGSELALAEALRSIDKEPIVLNPTPVTKKHLFLDQNKEIRPFVLDENRGLDQYEFDAAVILDISRWERLGLLADLLQTSKKPKICIDHHPYSGGFADYHLINTEACASAEIVYDLINYLNIPLNRRMAELLYASILSDTGSFSFSNTNARSHRIAAELLTHGIDSRTIFEQLFQNHTPQRLRFLGKVLSDLQTDCDEKLAWMTINYAMLSEHGLQQDDVEGFVDMARNCKRVVLSALFLEVQPNEIKISLRSKGDFNSRALANIFGGGGHNHASGINMFGPLGEIEQLVLTEARKALARYSG